MKNLKIIPLLGAVLVLYSLSWADIPKRINFQGVLKDTLGNPVPDGNYSITFRIYDSSGGNSVFWQEGKLIPVAGGLFTTLLGSAAPIPESVFADTSRWLGVQIGADPEISPRTRLASISYAYVADFAQNADKLDGLNSTDFVSAATDYGRSGVAADLYEGATTLTNKYVNVTGPDSVISTSGTAFLGKVSGSSTGTALYGIRGNATNSDGSTVGGFFQATSGGGLANAGYFQANSSGTGSSLGVFVRTFDSSSISTRGIECVAENTSTGIVYAGIFSAFSSGTGPHYGIYGNEAASGSGAAVYAAGDFAGSGAKYAVAKTSQGHRLLSVIESPEVWFEDFGEGQLINGQAHIELDPLFLETVTINSQNPMKVFIQLTSGNPVNVVVTKGTAGFDVTVSDNTSNSTFDYRIAAKRKGYENQRLKATDLGMDDPNLYPELWEKIEKEHQ